MSRSTHTLTNDYFTGKKINSLEEQTMTFLNVNNFDVINYISRS